MAYIFIDESGQFNKSDEEKNFVVASFTIGNPTRTEKAFRAWCGSRFPKKMKYLSEIKWSNSGIDEKLRLRTLQYIAKQDVRIRYVFLKKNNIPDLYRDGKKVKTGLLYVNVIAETIEMYLPPQEKRLNIICDQLKLKGLTQMQFKNQLRGRLLPKLPTGTIIEIEMIDSTTNANIQIVDWIVGALAHFHKGSHLGDKYFEILKNNLLDTGKELFTKNQ